MDVSKVSCTRHLSAAAHPGAPRKVSDELSVVYLAAVLPVTWVASASAAVNPLAPAVVSLVASAAVSVSAAVPPVTAAPADLLTPR